MKTILALRKTSIALGILMVISISVHWILQLYSINHSNNGFTRRFSLHNPEFITSFQHDGQITSISGISDDSLYFQTKTFGKLLISDHALKFARFRTYFSTEDKRLSSRYQSIFAWGNLYIFAGNYPAIILSSGQHKAFYNYPDCIYLRCVPIGPYSFVFRGYDTAVHTNDEIFYKANIITKNKVRENHLTTLKNDAGIPSDGLLYFDKTNTQLIYVYFYKNEFMCFDTNLNKTHIGHTIDTNSTTTTNEGAYNIGQSTKYTNASPKHTINKESCTESGLLFINSLIKADNESFENFSNNDVIDVYETRQGVYKGSFYIPKYNDEHLIRFKIVKNSLVILYKHAIATYKINLKI